MKVSDRFLLEEYVSKEVFEEYGHRAVRFISTALIEADTQLVIDLEAHFKRPISCTINNWKWGGQRNNSGLRMPGTTYYSKWSLHSMGSASDKQFKFKDGEKEVLRTREVYGFIKQNETRYYNMGIRRMENIKDATSWIHWDTMWTPSNKIGFITIVNG